MALPKVVHNLPGVSISADVGISRSPSRIPLPDGTVAQLLPFRPEIASIVVRSDRRPGFQVEIIAIVLDKETQSPIDITFNLNAEVAPTPFDAVRCALLAMLTHELDECLLLDGERVNDPHIHDVRKFEMEFSF